MTWFHEYLLLSHASTQAVLAQNSILLFLPYNRRNTNTCTHTREKIALHITHAYRTGYTNPIIYKQTRNILQGPSHKLIWKFWGNFFLLVQFSVKFILHVYDGTNFFMHIIVVVWPYCNSQLSGLRYLGRTNGSVRRFKLLPSFSGMERVFIADDKFSSLFIQYRNEPYLLCPSHMWCGIGRYSTIFTMIKSMVNENLRIRSRTKSKTKQFWTVVETSMWIRPRNQYFVKHPPENVTLQWSKIQVILKYRVIISGCWSNHKYHFHSCF